MARSVVVFALPLTKIFQDFFFAATETSSSAIEWAMAELLRCPEAMEKVREELRTVLGTRTEMEESDIAQLPYLQAVVKETYSDSTRPSPYHSIEPWPPCKWEATPFLKEPT